MEQALTLKEMMNRTAGEVLNKPAENAVKVISVTSGKGGVSTNSC